MHIVIHSMGLPFDGNTIKSQSLGGSETAAYYLAHELAKRGHRVELFTTSSKNETMDGVKYSPIGNSTQEHPLGDVFEPYAVTTPHDVLIIQRHPMAFHKKWAAKVCLWQLHDLALHRTTGVVWHGLWQVDAITCVSEWHRQQVIDVWGIKPARVRVVPNGVDPTLYDALTNPEIFEQAWPAALGGKFKMLYQSRPERGLEHLVKPGGIMSKLVDTDAHLFVCAYANTRPEMAPYYAQLQQWGALLPNVTELGALNKPVLAATQMASDLLLYPTEFGEVSCITAMEAMHAGLPMLSSECAALPETCRGAGAKLLPLLKDGTADEAAFVTQLRSLMPDQKRLARMKEKQLEAAAQCTWSNACDDLETLINDCFEEARTPARIVRHGFDHSDLEIARAGVIEELTPALGRELALYDFTDTDDTYRAQYERRQREYYEGPGRNAVGEDVTQTLRFRGVMTLLSQKQDAMDGKPMRVLDYGCAHGHYIVPFAKWMPASDFFGVDISARAIGKALEWKLRDNIENLSLGVGTLDAVAQFAAEERYAEKDGNGNEFVEVTDNRFDVIMANEVLEHVPDPWEMLAQLRESLKPDGWLIATTPIGRWEFNDPKTYRKEREHLWHFSREDLDAMLADTDHEILYAPGGVDRAHGVLGSYVWRFSNNGEPTIHRPTVSERLALTVPRQTISLCMIVKDAEKTLQKCVESAIEWVDEVVIAVDPTSTDRTPQVIERLREDFPLRHFVVLDGLSALADGFAAARNVTLEAATGDWILWCDADEEIQSPWELWKFAKESCVDGFALPQIHYSTSPAQVLTTDKPTRFFRKSCGAKFHGYVHEHPEVEQGKAVPYTFMREDVQFLHAGYVNEEVRRARYQRNAPLLFRDLEANPKRDINKFLAIRDIAQGVVFSLERTGGQLSQPEAENAQRVINMFEELLVSGHVRMLIDSLEYYSVACKILNLGFDAEIVLGFAKPPFNDLNVNTSAKGRFRNRDVHLKLIQRISEEATKHYESKYL